MLCVPTIPTFVTLAEIAADPIGPNAELGTYTNFVNLLDMCGIAVPTGSRADGRPASVTFLATAGRDGLCAALGASVEAGRARRDGLAAAGRAASRGGDRRRARSSWRSAARTCRACRSTAS